MAEQVTLPGVGPVKREWLYAGAALVAGIVGYAWIRRSRTPPVVLDPNADIGATGYAGTPGASSSAPVNVDNRDNGAIDTNAKWVQYAAEKLGQYGFEPGAVAAALGKWLQRQPLTDAEISMVTSARGVAGDPPTGGPYPVIHALPTPAPGGGGTPPPAGTKTVHVPGGELLRWILQAHPGLTLAKIRELNPTAPITMANAGGFVGAPGNKDTSPGEPVWGADFDVVIPA